MNIEISDTAHQWLLTGERGLSSETIFSQLTGLNLVGRWGMWHPLDPDDLRRCRLLLEAVPEFQGRLLEMAEVSPTWARLVEHWDELCTLMDTEAPQWRAYRGRAPKTYERMKGLRVMKPYEERIAL